MQSAPLFEDIAGFPPGGRACWLKADDGIRLRAAHWSGDGRGTLLIFPGRSEYIEKYGRILGDLLALGHGCVVIDWRGQGLSDRLTGDPSLGHVRAFADYQRDVAALVGHAGTLAMPEPWFLLGHSMGGCIGLRALHRGLPVRAAAFSAPMWGIGLSPAMKPAAMALGWGARKSGRGESYAPGTGPVTYVMTDPFDDNMLTGDRDTWDWLRMQAGAHPELTLGGPSLHWLHEALLETAALARMKAPDMPALTFAAGNERVVDGAAIRRMMRRWPRGRLREIAGAEHEMLMERPAIRRAVIRELGAFLSAPEDGGDTAEGA